MDELENIARSASFRDLRLESLSNGELLQLHRLVSETWSDVTLDADDALVIRFEWLMPMIDAELRARDDGEGL